MSDREMSEEEMSEEEMSYDENDVNHEVILDNVIDNPYSNPNEMMRYLESLLVDLNATHGDNEFEYTDGFYAALNDEEPADDSTNAYKSGYSDGEYLRDKGYYYYGDDTNEDNFKRGGKVNQVFKSGTKKFFR